MEDYFVSQLKRIVAILIISVLAGTVLLTLSFCIPTGPMKKNAAKSLDYMIQKAENMEEGSYARYLWAHKETYTDAIMVQNALESREDQNAFEEAMWANHSDVNPDFWNPEDSLKAYSTDSWEGEVYQHTYARYWHGYLIYLKPLLLLFSWKQLVILGAVFQTVLILIIIILSITKKQPAVGIALVAGLLYAKPIVMMASLTMAVCSVITMTAMIFMLMKHEKIEKSKYYPQVFLIIGILTAYFDFLTYPIMTLGFVLCTYFLITDGETLFSYIKKLIYFCVCWGIGYAGMWGMKWVVADVTLRTGTLRDAAWSILGRTEVIGGRPRLNGGFYTISLNLQEYDSKWYGIGAIVLLAIALITVAIAVIRKKAKPVLEKTILFAITFCIPFVWIIVVQHHSALHARFTFRIISVAAMALACISIEAVKQCCMHQSISASENDEK